MVLLHFLKVEEADRVFSAMIEKHGVRPTTALYNALIKGHAKNGDAKTSFHLFNVVSVL